MLTRFFVSGALLLSLTSSFQASADEACRARALEDYQIALRECSAQTLPEHNVCVPRCVARYSSGSCMTYGADYCAPRAECTENCVARYSSGSCMTYGPDVCGRNPECSENCVARYSSGSCMTYGPDSCSASEYGTQLQILKSILKSSMK